VTRDEGHGGPAGSARFCEAGIRALQDASARCRSGAGTSARERPADHDVRPPETARANERFGAGFEPATAELSARCSATELATVEWRESNPLSFRTRFPGRQPAALIPVLTPPSLEPVRGTRVADHEVGRRAPSAWGYQLLRGPRPLSSVIGKTLGMETGRGVKPRELALPAGASSIGQPVNDDSYSPRGESLKAISQATPSGRSLESWMAERERFELSRPSGLGTLAVCWAPRSPFPLHRPPSTVVAGEGIEPP
jgi:hypothetical protein